jgi:DNA-directed RNA polymerase subunit K/omega
MLIEKMPSLAKKDKDSFDIVIIAQKRAMRMLISLI